jgi:plasmid stabilization system protein ParE
MSDRFVLSAPASQDLDDILTYVLDQDGPERAQHVVDRLCECFQKLAANPGLGRRREDLTSARVLFWPVWSYLVIYRPDSTPLEIVRVLHGARDLPPLLEGI